MSLSTLLGGGLGTFAEKVGGVVDRFIQTKDEKAAVMLEIEKLAAAQASEIEQSVRAEITAKEKILVAELTQGDNYTKRARPTVIYTGLAVIVVNYCVAPILFKFTGTDLPTLDLPPEFWYSFAAMISVYKIGRTMEKRGVKSKVTEVVTGHQGQPSSLLD